VRRTRWQRFLFLSFFSSLFFFFFFFQHSCYFLHPQILEDRDKAIEGLQQEVASLSTELRDKSVVADRLRDSSDRVDRLGVENKTLLGQLEEMRKRNVELTNEKADLTDRFQTTDSRASKFQKELERLREAHRHEVQNLMSLQGTATLQPGAHPGELENLRQRNADLTAELERLKAGKRASFHASVHQHHHLAGGPSKEDDTADYLAIIESYKKIERQLRTEIALYQAKERDEKSQGAQVADKEKESITTRLKQDEVTIAKLQMEVETIPEYIELYHRERNSLKAKTAEKDKIISQLVDRSEKQRKALEETRSALRDLLREHEQLKERGGGSPGRPIQQQKSRPPTAAGEHPEEDDDEVSPELQHYLTTTRKDSPHLSFPPCQNCVGRTMDV